LQDAEGVPLAFKNYSVTCARAILGLLLILVWLQPQNVFAAPGPVSWVSISSGCSGNNPEISLAWTTATGATSYYIYRNNTYLTSTTATSYQDSAVIGGTTYFYYIQAVNSTGATQTGSSGSTPPSNCGGSAPGPVSWVSISSGCSGNSPEVSLAWTTATGATSYYVYRNNSFLTSLTGTTYEDLNVTGGIAYSYYIQAVNSTGATQTAPLSDTPPSNCEGSAPGPVSWMSISSGCNGNSPEISLAWTTATGANSYYVYRNNSFLTSVASTTFEDVNVMGGTTYNYYIQAVNSMGATQTGLLGSTPPSNCGSTAPGAFTFISATPRCDGNSPNISLVWTAASGATSYNVYRNGNVYSRGVNGTNFEDGGVNVVAGTTYTYFVQAVNSNGATQTGTLPATAPSSCSSALIALSSPNGGENWVAGSTQTITWTVSDPLSQINYYLLDYSLDGGITWNFNAADAFPPSTSATWTIPSNISSTQAQVRLKAYNSSAVQVAGSVGASNFTIRSSIGTPTSVPTCNNRAPSPASAVTVNFNGSGSTGSSPACGIESYLWTFGDGGTSTAPNPVHTFYPAPGSATSYNVYLQVTDSCGKTAANTLPLTVNITGLALGNNSTQPTSKDPVNLATGNYIYNHVDLQIPGRGLPFEFQRYYNSKDTASTGLPLGFGWTDSYNIQLSVSASNSAVAITFGDGHEEMYTTNGVGGYFSQQGIYNVLTGNGNDYILTTKEQQQYNFNAAGQLTSLVDKNNNAVTLGYTGNNLTTITDTVGRVINFAYDTNDCLTNITDPLGRTVQFAYDANTNLISVTDMRGGLTQFSYDQYHQLTNAVDPRDNIFVSMVYDDEQRVVSIQKDALQNTTTFGYDFVNNVTTVMDAMGNVSFDHFDSQLRIVRTIDNLGYEQFFQYDTNNNRTMVGDKNGAVTYYAYDGNGNVIAKTNAQLQTTTIAYDALNNPTNRLDALNGQTIFRYDSRGNLTNLFNSLGKTNAYQYDTFGEVIAVTDANGNSNTNSYDGFGNLFETTDSLGDTNAFAYDVVGRKIKQVDTLGRTNLFSYDNADNLTDSVNALGQTNYFTFDGNNNRITATDFNGNTTTNVYDQKDRLIVVCDPMGGSITNDYDALDRKITVWDAMGGVTWYSYDVDNNLLAVTNAVGGVTLYTYDPNGNNLSLVDALGNSTQKAYDALNRLVSTTDALRHTTASVYDALGRRIQEIDALNRTNLFAYDSMGRLTNFTDTAGGTVAYTYDNVGNRTSMIDPNGHTNTYTFDALNRLVRTTDPDGSVAHFGYDADGNLIWRTDPNGNTTTYQHDADNQCTNITYPTGSPVTFNYDNNGNRTGMTDSLGVTSYSYNALNRLTNVVDCYGKTVGYEYDKNGNRTAVLYPGGKTVMYGYDAMNRLNTVTDWLSNTTTYNYDANGNLTNSVNPDGTSAAYHYDSANRLTALTNTLNSTIISSYQYTLDAVGNQSQVNQTEQLPNTVATGQSTYAYDSDNRQITLNGQTQGFNANGNMVSASPTNLLVYDYENHLTQTSFAGTTNAYQYDGTGNRLSASRSGAVTCYVLDRNSLLAQVLAETDTNGNIIYYYIYGLGLISRIDAIGNAQYYHYDSRGSTIAMTSASGQISAVYAYDPFGQPMNAVASDNHFRYLGRYGVMDEENGLLYIRARYYCPALGRFITKDPTTGKEGDGQSMNRYIYALNNPVRLIDVSGFSSEDPNGAQMNLNESTDSSTLHNRLLDAFGGAAQLTLGVFAFLGGVEEVPIGIAVGAPYGLVGGVVLATPGFAEIVLGLGGFTSGGSELFSAVLGATNPLENVPFLNAIQNVDDSGAVDDSNTLK
jgi:RHS repeat-associated protein